MGCVLTFSHRVINNTPHSLGNYTIRYLPKSNGNMVSVCLPSDALLQHLLSYLGFSYLGHGGITSRLLQQRAAAAPYLGRGVSPHHHPS